MKNMMLALFLTGICVLPTAAGEAGAAGDETPVLELNAFAENWKWDPDVIRVQEGTRVILHIKNRDAPHAFLLKAYRIKVPLPQDETTTVEFVADRPGEFTWRCGRPCGNGCPKMRGKLIVLPATEEAG